METTKLINGLIKNVNAINIITKKTFGDLDDATYNWRYKEETWSILECFEHLNIYNRYYNAALRKAIDKSKKSSPKKTFKSGWFGKRSINMLKPANIKRQKTIKRFNPIYKELDKSVIEEFLQHQEDLLVMLEEAKSINISRNRVPVEFMKFIRMKIGDTFKFIVVHEQRHLQQATRCLKLATRHLKD